MTSGPLPAYGHPLLERRQAGERIGLLVVGVHDWRAGREIETRPNVARVVLAEDKLPHELDWSCAVALDCLIVGECADPVFYATALMLFAAGAASVWGEFADGFWRLERGSTKLYPHGLHAADGPFSDRELARRMKIHREWSIMRREGVYGTKPYAQARRALFGTIFLHLANKAMAWVDGDLKAAS